MKKKETPESDPGKGRVLAEDTWEVNYMAEKFKVSKRKILNAIRTVGHNKEKLALFLKGPSTT